MVGSDVRVRFAYSISSLFGRDIGRGFEARFSNVIKKVKKTRWRRARSPCSCIELNYSGNCISAWE